jgi:Putative Ig domain
VGIDCRWAAIHVRDFEKTQSAYFMTRLFLILLFVTANAFAVVNITPFLTCVVNDPVAAATTAYFGYESFEQSIVTIPIGSDNRFIPDPPSRNQPTLFLPGYFEKAFRVTFPSSGQLFWSFNGFAIPVGSSSPACPVSYPGPALPPGTISVPYSQQLSAIGGQTGITWSALSTLPLGLTLSQNGLLSGTPLAAGQFSIVVQAGDGSTTDQRTYLLPIANAVMIDDPVSLRAPGFTPEFRVAMNVSSSVNATVSCNLNEFVVTGGGACTIPNSNTILGRVAAMGPAANGWQVSCSGGTATAIAVCSLK